jgi:hypothetical protein
MYKYLRSFPLLVFAIFLIPSILAQLPKNGKANENAKIHSVVKRSLTYKLINSEQNTFGYDILDNNRPIIHQPSIPGMPGNKGFIKKEDAAKVARLVIKKMNKNIMPPTVTRQDLKKLHVVFNS